MSRAAEQTTERASAGTNRSGLLGLRTLIDERDTSRPPSMRTFDPLSPLFRNVLALTRTRRAHTPLERQRTWQRRQLVLDPPPRRGTGGRLRTLFTASRSNSGLWIDCTEPNGVMAARRNIVRPSLID